MSQPLVEFAGSSLYLDTMVFYALLRGSDVQTEELFARVESGELQAYTSVLTFDELAYRLLLALTRDRYGGSPLDRLRGQESATIAEFYPQVAPHLARLRTFPNLVLLDVTAADLDTMDLAMARFSLRPRDALHFAAMEKSGCFDLVSSDPDFDRVASVRRWVL